MSDAIRFQHSLDVKYMYFWMFQKLGNLKGFPLYLHREQLKYGRMRQNVNDAAYTCKCTFRGHIPAFAHISTKYAYSGIIRTIVITSLYTRFLPNPLYKHPFTFVPFHQILSFKGNQSAKRSNLDLKEIPSCVTHYVCSPVDPCKDLSHRAATKGSKPKVCDNTSTCEGITLLGDLGGEDEVRANSICLSEAKVKDVE